MTPPPPSVEQLTRALSAVGHLIAGIRDDQWSAPTPCTDWTVHDLVNHLVGVSLVSPPSCVTRSRPSSAPTTSAITLPACTATPGWRCRLRSTGQPAELSEDLAEQALGSSPSSAAPSAQADE